MKREYTTRGLVVWVALLFFIVSPNVSRASFFDAVNFQNIFAGTTQAASVFSWIREWFIDEERNVAMPISTQNIVIPTHATTTIERITENVIYEGDHYYPTEVIERHFTTTRQGSFTAEEIKNILAEAKLFTNKSLERHFDNNHDDDDAEDVLNVDIETGDLLYGDDGELVTLAVGGEGTVLQISGGLPAWVATSTLGIVGGASTFDALTDVDITGASVSDILSFNGTEWVDTSTSTFVVESELDSLSELETLTGVSNILIENDIDASSELISLMDDETGTGNLVFSTTPLLEGFRSNASSTIGDGTGAGGLTIYGNSTTTGNIYTASNIGIGTTSPSARLTISGIDGALTALFRTATSTGTTTFEVLASGDVEVANNLINAGVTWTARSAAGNNDRWYSVTYGNGLFVAVSDFGDVVMTSPDGVNWTTSSAAGNNDDWYGVTYGNGLFVAVGGSGDRVMTSPDGINWTARSAVGNNDDWQSVTYGNGLFVAVGRSGDYVMTSPDGINWTARTAAGDNDSWYSVTYGNGLFVAVGEGGDDVVMTSPDGTNWTARSAEENNEYWYGVTYGNGLFVAVGGGGTNDEYVMTSPDGITWTARSAAGDNDSWLEVAYGNGLFIATGNNTSDRIMTSPDGITWTARSGAGNNDDWYGVTYGNGLFVAVSDSGDRVMTSGKTSLNALAHNNIYQGGMSILGGPFNIGTTTATTSSFYSNILNIASTTGTSLLTMTQSGNLGLGTTSPSARFALTQSANTAVGGFILATSDNTDSRSSYMDTSGVLSFYGGDTGGTLNTATLNAAGEWTNASDIAYKEHIETLSYGLDTVLLLNPRSYTIKNTTDKRVGFIAQEVELVIPEVVGGEEGKKGISYGNMVAVAVKAIQDFYALVIERFERNESKIDALEERIRELESREGIETEEEETPPLSDTQGGDGGENDSRESEEEPPTDEIPPEETPPESDTEEEGDDDSEVAPPSDEAEEPIEDEVDTIAE